MGLGQTDTVIMTEPSEPMDGGESGKDGQKVWDDESEGVQYNYRYLQAQEKKLPKNFVWPKLRLFLNNFCMR